MCLLECWKESLVEVSLLDSLLLMAQVCLQACVSILNLSIMHAPAIASEDYKYTQVDITCSPTQMQRSVAIAINDDNLLEFNETFSLSLSLVSIASNVTIDPNTAQITIVDDES